MTKKSSAISATASKRVLAYIKAVESGKQPAPQTIKQAIARWKYLKNKYVYKPGILDKVVSGIESLHCPEGNFGRFKLMDWQCFLMSILYSFWKPDERRVIKELLLVVPRKAGKSSLMGAIMAVEACEPTGNIKSPRIACLGANIETARHSFDKLLSILSHDEVSDGGRMKRAYKLRATKNEVVSKITNARIFPVSLAARTLDGMTLSCAIIDEISACHNTEKIDVIRSGFGSAHSPLLVMTTTPGDLPTSAYDIESERAINFLNNPDDPQDHYFPLIWSAEKDDEADDPKTWYKAQPSLGQVVDEDYYWEQWQAGKDNAKKKHNFLTRQLCMNVRLKGAWITSDMWDETPDPPTEPERSLCDTWHIGLDPSDLRDLTAITLLGYNSNENKAYCWFYPFYPKEQLPEMGEAIKTNTGGVDGRMHDWVRDGFVTITPGKTIDQQMVAEKLNELHKKFQPITIVSDGYFSLVEIKEHLTGTARAKIREASKTKKNFTEPIGVFSSWVQNKTLHIQKSPIARQHMLNVCVNEGFSGGMIIEKATPDSPHKIDIMDSLLNAVVSWQRSRDIKNLGKIDAPVKLPDRWEF